MARLLLTLTLGFLTAPADPPPVRVTYLANEGVMLTSARGRVFIDALFGEGLPEYAVVPRPSRDSLERAAGGYGGPGLLLFTHAHRDHYDSAAVARCLASNPGAVAIGPPGAAPHGEIRAADLGWAQARPVPVPHGPTIHPVGHTGWLVTIEGLTAVHLGDTSGDPRSWPDLNLPEAGVDVALVPYWLALDEGGFRALLEVVRARTVVLLHVGLAAAEGDWPAQFKELQARYPQVRAPSRPGEIVDLVR